MQCVFQEKESQVLWTGPASLMCEVEAVGASSEEGLQVLVGSTDVANVKVTLLRRPEITKIEPDEVTLLFDSQHADTVHHFSLEGNYILTGE